MLKNLCDYCERSIESPDDLKNKASAYEYLVKRFFESYFKVINSYTLDLFPIIENHLTPDMELSTSLDNREIRIIIEIKYYENSSLNKKNARRIARRRMDDYINAYREKFPHEIIMPLLITPNPDFDNNPDTYPCVILSLKDLNEVGLHRIILKIEKYVENHSNSEHITHSSNISDYGSSI